MWFLDVSKQGIGVSIYVFLADEHIVLKYFFQSSLGVDGTLFKFTVVDGVCACCWPRYR